MIKFRAWWFDVLLAVVVIVSVFGAMSDGKMMWPYWLMVVVAFVLVAGGYIGVHPRMAHRIDGQRGWNDWVSCAAIVVGVAAAAYVSPQFSWWLAFACPVVWIAIGDLVPGLIWNVAMIGLVVSSELIRVIHDKTLAADWPGVIVVGVFITVFSVVMGLMVHAAIRWGKERGELIDELQTSQAELAESYRQLLAEQTPSPNATECPLSGRELEVLTLVADGLTNRQIGDRLFVSPATVKTHMEHILVKLDATTRTQAVLIAHRDGFLPQGQALSD